jgi:P-type Cu2+ transporter
VSRPESKQPVTVVLDVRPMLRGSEKAVVEARLLPSLTSLEELREWLEECGLHCTGQSVPLPARAGEAA